MKKETKKLLHDIAVVVLLVAAGSAVFWQNQILNKNWEERKEFIRIMNDQTDQIIELKTKEPWIIYNSTEIDGDCSLAKFPGNFNEAFYSDPPNWYVVLDQKNFVCEQDYWGDTNVTIPGWCQCGWK